MTQYVTVSGIINYPFPFSNFDYLGLQDSQSETARQSILGCKRY